MFHSMQFAKWVKVLLQMKVAQELQKGSVATYMKSVQIDHIKGLPFADLVIPDITSGLRNQKLCLAHFTCYMICSSTNNSQCRPYVSTIIKSIMYFAWTTSR